MAHEIPVYGAGPAGLMAAEVLANNGQRVVLHDHMPTPARKFLLAGRGGLNLTHSEELEPFLSRYGDARARLEPAIRQFSPSDLVKWSHDLGIETFVGSSGRIFPRVMKASPLLRAWLRRLAGQGVTLRTRSPWQGFVEPFGICAFGGASWPQLGSDAGWVPAFRAAGVSVNDFQPTNCRAMAGWSEYFSTRHAGAPIKNVALAYEGLKSRGELIVSRDGLEGGAIYALSRIIRERPGRQLVIDLKPDLPEAEIALRLTRPRGKQSRSNFLRKTFGLSPAAISLMTETKSENPKAVAVELSGLGSLERAISSAGGVDWGDVGEDFSLRPVPGWHVAGEMLDWEAPTGGYLLQACLATGAAAARGLLARL